MDLDSEGLDVAGAVGSAREVREVELNLVPALVQPHRHCANERFYTSCALKNFKKRKKGKKGIKGKKGKLKENKDLWVFIPGSWRP